MRLFILFGVGGADIAGQVRDRRARGIVARKAAGRRDAGQFGQMDVDRGEMIPVDAFGDLYRLKTRGVLQIEPDPLDLLGR